MDLANLSKWKQCDSQRDLVLRGKAAPRRIRLDLNASHETGVYVVHDGKNPQFVANVLGRQTVQFRAGGDVQIAFAIPDRGQCWYHTADGETVHFVKDDAVSFTKVWQRKPRNHDLELLMYRQRQQQDAFMKRLQDETDRRMAALERRASDGEKAAFKELDERAKARETERKAVGDGGKDAPPKGRTDERKAGDGKETPESKTPTPNGANEHGSGTP